MVEPARRVSARLQAIPESATLAITAQAAQLRAAGDPVIGLGVGAPDFPTLADTAAASQPAPVEPPSYRHTPAAGLPALRPAIAVKTLRHSGVAVDPSHVIVPTRGKQTVYIPFPVLTE